MYALGPKEGWKGETRGEVKNCSGAEVIIGKRTSVGLCVDTCWVIIMPFKEIDGEGIL